MKKKYLLFMIIGMFAMIGNVFAVSTYYVDDSGNYMLCAENGGCIPIQENDSKSTFNLGKGEIIRDGVTFYYDSTKEAEYQKSQAGKTRMYFYRNNSDRYVLCSTTTSCKTYSFDQLKNIASVSSSKIVFNNGNGPGEAGDTYLFSQERQDEYSTAHPSKSDKDEDSSSKSNTNNDDSTSDSGSSTTGICKKIKEPLKFVGYVVLVFKIIIPIVLLIFGALDFFRGVTSSKDDEIKKSAKSFAFRILAAVIIFFLPTIISLIFSFINSWDGVKGDFEDCQKCVLRVGECK